MKPFMVVATFKPGTNMADVMAVVPEEQARIRELQAEGRINALYLATAARQTVFLESFGDDIDDVVSNAAGPCGFLFLSHRAGSHRL